MPVRVHYYTDPACSASWGAEPSRRALMVEFGKDLQFTYVMGGLARDYEAGYSDAEAGLEAGRIYETLLLHWLERARTRGCPSTRGCGRRARSGRTFPACMAVKAAAEQGPEAEDRYLRALREGLLCLRRKLDAPEPLVDAARDAGLDVERFRIDLASNAIVEAFGAELEESRPADAVREAAGERAGRRADPAPGAPPSTARTAERGWVLGRRALRGVARRRPGGRCHARGRPRPEPHDALRRFGHMATRGGGGGVRPVRAAASAELWRLATEGRVRPVRVVTGTLWEAA